MKEGGEQLCVLGVLLGVLGGFVGIFLGYFVGFWGVYRRNVVHGETKSAGRIF